MNKSGFLGYVHSFRGFAILNIVAIHAFAFAQLIPANWEPDKTAPLYVLNETLLHDSTLYFALISGLLFSSILRARGYRHFFRNKLRYVVAPYLCCTIAFSWQGWNIDGTGVIAGPESAAAYLDSIWPNLLWGEAQFTYWYIPILLTMFAMTPLLDRLARAKSLAPLPVWVVMLAPLFLSRPEFDPGEHQYSLGTLVYFTGGYTAGIYLGNDLEGRLDALRRNRFALLLVAAVATVMIAALQFREINRVGGISLQETLFYVQKLAFAGFVLVWLRNRGLRQPRWLTVFANEAFSIYFLHAFFMALLAHFLWYPLRDPDYLPASIYLMGPVYLVIALSASMAVVAVLRRLFGKHSRVLIGS